MEASGAVDRQSAARELFDARFLLKRPLLQALSGDGARRPVLLIDELDRADEEFEGFLLEFLADFQITIPEHGTIRAAAPPIVVVTSTDARAHDALAARLYFWIDLPDFDKEPRTTAKVPHARRLASGHRLRPVARGGQFPRSWISDTRPVARSSRSTRPSSIRRSSTRRSASIKNQEDMQEVRGEKGERPGAGGTGKRGERGTEELRN
jgi:hypothetical protein